MATKTDYARKCQQLDVLIDLLERENKRLRELIVHCKDCKFRDPEDKRCDCGAQWCAVPKNDEDFCSYGERRATE